MPKQLQISIPTPCHEDWDAMTPEQKGRFCGVCSKTVVDFTLMTDGQILDVIKNTKGKACGHFSTDQLNRPLIEPLQPKWYMVGMWKYLISGFLIIKGGEAKAQLKDNVVITNCISSKKKISDTIPEDIYNGRTMGMVARVEVPKEKQIKYELIVKDEQGEPIVGAKVKPNRYYKEYTTNMKGVVSFQMLGGGSVTISHKGYKTESITAKKGNNEVILKALFQFKVGEIAVSKVEDEKIQTVVCYPSYRKITFFVKDIDGNPISNASIRIEKNRNHETIIANKAGEFEVRKSDLLNINNVTISSVGYIAQQISITELKAKKVREKNEIILEKKITQHEDAVVTSSVYGVRKGGFSVSVIHVTNIVKDSIEKVIPNELTIYPNPAKANENIHLVYQSGIDETIMFQIITMDGKNRGMYKKQALKGQNTYQIQMPAIASQFIVIQLMNNKGQWIASEKIMLH